MYCTKLCTEWLLWVFFLTLQKDIKKNKLILIFLFTFFWGGGMGEALGRCAPGFYIFIVLSGAQWKKDSYRIEIMVIIGKVDQFIVFNSTIKLDTLCHFPHLVFDTEHNNWQIVSSDRGHTRYGQTFHGTQLDENMCKILRTDSVAI